EDYLHDEMEYVVVETYDAARSGVSLLREQMAGRATFLVDSFGRFPPKLVEEAARPAGAGVIAPVAELVHLNGPLGSEARRVLPKLGRSYLVESARAAEQLARDYPQYFFLSTDGTCYHGRLVSGGARNGYGSHSLTRELERATEQRTKIEPAASAAETTLDQLEARRRELERSLDHARQTLFAQEKNLLQLEQQLGTLEAERGRRQSEETRAAEQVAARENEQRAATERRSVLRQEVSRQERELAALEAHLLSTNSTLSEARQQLETGGGRLAELGARRATLEERLRSARQEQARLEETAARLATEQREIEQLAAQLEADRQLLAEELPARQAEVVERQQQKVEQEKRCAEGETELLSLRQGVLERDSALRGRRGQLESLREERHRLEVEQARLETEWQHAELAAQSEFGLTAEQLCAQVAERLAGEELAQVEARYAEIRERLENIGAVNMMALEELEESEQRHEFLAKQRADLLASIEDTTRAITEIDTVSKEKFDHAFAIINQNFAETFKTLFGGGSATLRMTDAENPIDSGVELICQPPGKRLQNVLLLSGGEKALAALALLIAIFRFQPSPFCILDEVDAPLDDTNVGRFTRLVRDMAPQTQFILITHNKRTMEIAALLYGVTMQSAVSQIVSVRFDEQPAAAPAA
ncbi:MAG: chromosome segregation protein SMC, partial [Candidatus Acidiferrales bacterium]